MSCPEAFTTSATYASTPGQSELTKPVWFSSTGPTTHQPRSGAVPRRRNMSATASDPTSAVRAVIGETIVIKGDVHSQEPLVIEGQVEGTIETGGHLLTVATGGNVRAHKSGHARARGGQDPS
ncbi:MAG: hypothetical protein DMG59_24180 [Acidobacteria bacterium]|nr:MAG: hypothetical protein DMG59_24180 [Acidobacteriota bacterium]